MRRGPELGKNKLDNTSRMFWRLLL